VQALSVIQFFIWGSPLNADAIKDNGCYLFYGTTSPKTRSFRATARTLLHERLGFSPDAIEAQLGHRVPDRLGGAYNRTKHLEERTSMMQELADYLDGLK